MWWPHAKPFIEHDMLVRHQKSLIRIIFHFQVIIMPRPCSFKDCKRSVKRWVCVVFSLVYLVLLFTCHSSCYWQNNIDNKGVCVCVCVCACLRACVCVCVRPIFNVDIFIRTSRPRHEYKIPCSKLCHHSFWLNDLLCLWFDLFIQFPHFLTLDLPLHILL